jgi:hypothetical protein
VFVTDFTAVELPLEEAVRRLLDEAPSRLADHAGAADAETATLHLRVGPAIDSGRGPAKTVRATLGALRKRGDRVLIPLRWEATGAMGMILPSLDADLELAPLRPPISRRSPTSSVAGSTGSSSIASPRRPSKPSSAA